MCEGRAASAETVSTLALPPLAACFLFWRNHYRGRKRCRVGLDSIMIDGRFHRITAIDLLMAQPDSLSFRTGEIDERAAHEDSGGMNLLVETVFAVDE